MYMYCTEGVCIKAYEAACLYRTLHGIAVHDPTSLQIAREDWILMHSPAM